MQQQTSHDHASSAMETCIQNCGECHQVCLSTAVHCLEMGGKHAGVAHITLLLDCAQICATSQDFMLWKSPHHPHICGECAETCTKCAADCEQLADGDQTMLHSAEVCRRCAESCRMMAQMAA